MWTEQVKVYTAALFGFSFPSVNLLLHNLSDLLNALVLLGQVGVAAVTILYIFAKWKNIRKGKDEENE